MENITSSKKQNIINEKYFYTNQAEVFFILLHKTNYSSIKYSRHNIITDFIYVRSKDNMG